MTTDIRPIRLADLKVGEQYVYDDLDQPYRLADALTIGGSERRGSAFYWPGDTTGKQIYRRKLTNEDQYRDKLLTPVDRSFEIGDWK